MKVLFTNDATRDIKGGNPNQANTRPPHQMAEGSSCLPDLLFKHETFKLWGIGYQLAANKLCKDEAQHFPTIASPFGTSVSDGCVSRSGNEAGNLQ